MAAAGIGGRGLTNNEAVNYLIAPGSWRDYTANISCSKKQP